MERVWEAVDLDDEDEVMEVLMREEQAAGNHPAVCGQGHHRLLHWAARQGLVPAVSLLVRRGADVACRNAHGDTLLHVAARFRRVAVVEYLLSELELLRHVGLDAKNEDGDTALHVAAGCGAIHVAKRLCCAGAALNAQNHRGDTALHLACRSGSALVTKFLLTFDGLDASIKNADGDTALHVAVRDGKIRSVEILQNMAQRSGKVDARNKAKLTPLQTACAWYHDTSSLTTHKSQHVSKEVVEMLMREGADVNASCPDGNSPLHFAARSGSAAAIVALLSSNYSHSGGSARSDDGEADGGRATADVVQFSGANGVVQSRALSPPKVAAPAASSPPADKDSKRADFLTWIKQALIKGEVEADEILPTSGLREFYTTEWLLERNPSSPEARVNMPNKKGETALHLAVKGGHRAAAEALLDLGADVNRMNKYMETPLDYAFGAKHDGVAAVLISKGAEITDKLKHALVELAIAEVGKNPLLPRPRYSWDLQEDALLLHTAAMAGRAKIVEALLMVEAQDVNARNEWKQTPLHCAAILGETGVVMSLAERPELRANAEDKAGKTALQYAIECKHTEVEKALLERSDVKESMDRLYRDRQVYVDAANAILVGAALIGGVTFAGWLQPPLGYQSDGYAALDVAGVRAFWALDSLSFGFAMCTVLAGAGAVIPRPEVYIGVIVQEVRRGLAVAAFLLVVSIQCVLGAFAAAGFAVLPPSQRPGTLIMASTVALGGALALALMSWFLHKLHLLLPPWCTAWWRRCCYNCPLFPSSFLPASASYDLSSATSPPSPTPSSCTSVSMGE